VIFVSSVHNHGNDKSCKTKQHMQMAYKSHVSFVNLREKKCACVSDTDYMYIHH
jgi:hypothetical protein